MLNEPPPIHSYGRRATRMTAAQQRAYERRHRSPFFLQHRSYAAMHRWGSAIKQPIILEIGSGMGDATIAFAQRYAHLALVAVEVYKAGIGKLLWAIERHHIKNLYLIEADIAALILAPPTAPLFSGVHIHFPDPWPKRRHKKRRLLQPPFLQKIVSSMLPYAYLSIATDVADYAHDIVAHSSALPLHRDSPHPFIARPQWREVTAFEARALQKRQRIYEMLVYKKED